MQNLLALLLHRFRNRLGISQVNLAANAGIDPSYFSFLERGLRTNPSGWVLENLARELKLNSKERIALHLAASQTDSDDQKAGVDVLNDIAQVASVLAEDADPEAKYSGQEMLRDLAKIAISLDNKLTDERKRESLKKLGQFLMEQFESWE